MASNQQNQPAEAGDSLAIIEPGQHFRLDHDKISSIVLNRPHPWFWYVGFGSRLS